MPDMPDLAVLAVHYLLGWGGLFASVVFLCLYLWQSDFRVWPVPLLAISLLALISTWTFNPDTGYRPRWMLASSPRLTQTLAAQSIRMPVGIRSLTCWADHANRVQVDQDKDSQFVQYTYACDVDPSEGDRFRVIADSSKIENGTYIDSAGIGNLMFEAKPTESGAITIWAHADKAFVTVDEAAQAVSALTKYAGEQALTKKQAGDQAAKDSAAEVQREHTSRASWAG